MVQGKGMIGVCADAYTVHYNLSEELFKILRFFWEQLDELAVSSNSPHTLYLVLVVLAVMVVVLLRYFYVP